MQITPRCVNSLNRIDHQNVPERKDGWNKAPIKTLVSISRTSFYEPLENTVVNYRYEFSNDYNYNDAIRLWNRYLPDIFVGSKKHVSFEIVVCFIHLIAQQTI